METKGLQPELCLIKKVIQFFETMVVRHGVMLVGPTGGGKTTCYEVSGLSWLCYFWSEEKVHDIHIDKFCAMCLIPSEWDSFKSYREVFCSHLPLRWDIYGELLPWCCLDPYNTLCIYFKLCPWIKSLLKSYWCRFWIDLITFFRSWLKFSLTCMRSLGWRQTLSMRRFTHMYWTLRLSLWMSCMEVSTSWHLSGMTASWPLLSEFVYRWVTACVVRIWQLHTTGAPPHLIMPTSWIHALEYNHLRHSIVFYTNTVQCNTISIEVLVDFVLCSCVLIRIFLPSFKNFKLFYSKEKVNI